VRQEGVSKLKKRKFSTEKSIASGLTYFKWNSDEILKELRNVPEIAKIEISPCTMRPGIIYGKNVWDTESILCYINETDYLLFCGASLDEIIDTSRCMINCIELTDGKSIDGGTLAFRAKGDNYVRFREWIICVIELCICEASYIYPHIKTFYKLR
jgi:hypothetical protein